MEYMHEQWEIDDEIDENLAASVAGLDFEEKNWTNDANTKILKNNAENWSTFEVQEWLANLGLSRYAHLFEHKTGGDVLRLTEADLRQAGVSIRVHRVKLYQAIHDLNISNEAQMVGRKSPKHTRRRKRQQVAETYSSQESLAQRRRTLNTEKISLVQHLSSTPKNQVLQECRISPLRTPSEHMWAKEALDSDGGTLSSARGLLMELHSVDQVQVLDWLKTLSVGIGAGQSDDWEEMLKTSASVLESEGYFTVRDLMEGIDVPDFKDDLRGAGMKKRLLNAVVQRLRALKTTDKVIPSFLNALLLCPCLCPTQCGYV
jgi:hypothetical protein